MNALKALADGGNAELLESLSLYVEQPEIASSFAGIWCPNLEDEMLAYFRQQHDYGFTKDNSLFQLPVSYFTPRKAWCSSPGYPNDQILFNREIKVRCLECHATFAKASTGVGGDQYDPQSIILRVDCERCHGPAAAHVKFQTEHPGITPGKFVINPGRLTRQQNLDNCALCHSGLRENIKLSFTFVTGDNLDEYSKPDYNKDSLAGLDVHGNQYGLLLSSKCFKNSVVLDCSSCHNPHKKESDASIFSERCIGCHKPGSKSFCTVKETEHFSLVKNCIDCHMPKMLSNKIMMKIGGYPGSVHDTIRTHRIGIYLAESERIRTAINKR